MARRHKAKSKAQPRPPQKAIFIGMASAVLITAFGVWMFRGEAKKAFERARPPATPELPDLFKLEDETEVFARYAGSESCRECHEEAYDLWRTSNHGMAERSLLSHLEDPAFVPTRTFKHGTQETTVSKVGDRYELITPGLDGTNGPFVAQRVIGNNPLRQFLVPFPGGRWQVTEAAWDPITNEWFDVYGEEDRKPGEWGHWTGRGMNWNTMCAVCHNTRLRKNYDPASDTYHTTMAERTVGCEACHGPMKDHVVWQEAYGKTRQPDPTLKPLTREQMFHVCASCHSRRMEFTGDFKPGDNYYDHHQLAIVDETDTWYPDGQNWDEDYEFTAFLGSRMHDANVRCVDCHDFHSSKRRMPGNYMCLTCHAVGMTNAPTIEPTVHSFHKEESTGNLCENCHMPQTPYMQRHWRHDHGFTIPDPLLTKEFGIPNACNRCHQDKTVDWSIEYLDQWYGTNMNRPYRTRAQIVARAKRGDPGSWKPLLTQMQTESSAYWRAVSARMLSLYVNEPGVVEALIGQLADTNVLVRVNAAHGLAPLAGPDRPEVRGALEKLLDDPIRGARFQAAMALRGELDTNSLAGSELLAVMRHNADQPVGQMQIAAYHMARGDTATALQYYRKAVEWDPYSPPMRHELAVVLSMMGRTREAVEQLREAIRLEPDEAEYHYKLALALNETGDPQGTIVELEKAVALDPRHARAWYNLGLARNASGDSFGAVDALLRAEGAEPNDPRIPYARATILMRDGDYAGAREAAGRALAIDPNHAQALALIRSLDGGR